jgi:putative phosphoesterase
MLIGVLSDTHGALPPEVEKALQGVDRIIHAGDIGGAWILDHLEAIAPVVAVRGNMDSGELEWRLQDRAVIQADDQRILVVHQAASVLRAGVPEGVTVLVSGHTHRAGVERLGTLLHVNPGSAGGRSRDGRGPTVALLDCTVDPPTARIVEL